MSRNLNINVTNKKSTKEQAENPEQCKRNKNYLL